MRKPIVSTQLLTKSGCKMLNDGCCLDPLVSTSVLVIFMAWNTIFRIEHGPI